MKGAIKIMPNLNLNELNSIREVVTCHQLVSHKLQDYSNKCTDSQIKQMFGQAAQKAQDSANNLISML